MRGVGGGGGRGESDFPHKNGGGGKIDGVIFKKEEVSLILIITLPSHCYVSLSV